MAGFRGLSGKALVFSVPDRSRLSSSPAPVSVSSSVLPKQFGVGLWVNGGTTTAPSETADGSSARSPIWLNERDMKKT